MIITLYSHSGMILICFPVQNPARSRLAIVSGAPGRDGIITPQALRPSAPSSSRGGATSRGPRRSVVQGKASRMVQLRRVPNVVVRAGCRRFPGVRFSVAAECRP